MKILVLGKGGREHALCRALATMSPPPVLFVAPGNPGIAEYATTVHLDPCNIQAVVTFAQSTGIDCVIPGPEAPLVAGVTDALAQVGIACCGPSQAAAQLEGSKAFTRRLGLETGVPSPVFKVVTKPEEAREACESIPGVPVVKADGLAAGKGVYLPDTREECLAITQELLQGALGDAGKVVVLEERLVGIEASLFYACHGTDYVSLPHAKDHKRLLNNDQGPNTGGMGAVSPNPYVTPKVMQEVETLIVQPTLRVLKEKGMPFVGFLFVGVMITEQGVKLLEFNVRLGDPETEAILPRMLPGEFLRLSHATAHGKLQGFQLGVSEQATCAVVMASKGYPNNPELNTPIHVGTSFPHHTCWIEHAGTSLHQGVLVTAGGRVAVVVASGNNVAEAQQKVYQGVSHVVFEGAHFRQDIGNEAAV